MLTRSEVLQHAPNPTHMSVAEAHYFSHNPYLIGALVLFIVVALGNFLVLRFQLWRLWIRVTVSIVSLVGSFVILLFTFLTVLFEGLFGLSTTPLPQYQWLTDYVTPYVGDLPVSTSQLSSVTILNSAPSTAIVDYFSGPVSGEDRQVVTAKWSVQGVPHTSTFWADIVRSGTVKTPYMTYHTLSQPLSFVPAGRYFSVVYLPLHYGS